MGAHRQSCEEERQTWWNSAADLPLLAGGRDREGGRERDGERQGEKMKMEGEKGGARDD